MADESLTFSCGIVEHIDEDAKILIQMADDQMYYVKEHGRGHYSIAKR